jgi:hypothetical protein
MKKAFILCLAINWLACPAWAIESAPADSAPSKNPLTAMPLSHPSDWGDSTMMELGLSIGTPEGLNLGFGVRNIGGSGFYAKAYLGTLLVLWGGELEANSSKKSSKVLGEMLRKMVLCSRADQNSNSGSRNERASQVLPDWLFAF